MNTTTIYSGPSNDCNDCQLLVTARAGLARWIVKFEYTRKGQTKTRTGAWFARGAWDPTRYSPDEGSEARAIAEAWLLANSVPGVGVRP